MPEIQKKIKGYITAKEAAEKLGYEYTHMARLLKAGNVPGAVYWNGYAVPEDVRREDVKPGVPPRESEKISKKHPESA